MFTGIVAGTGRVVAIERSPGLSRITVEFPAGLGRELSHGASVSIDGVCLTVSAHTGNTAAFDVMQETLRRTTLGTLQESSLVNVERSACSGQEVGGHILSGHIDCTAKIALIERPENNYVLTFQVPQEWMKYIFAKGFIAVQGCSLTVTDPDYSAATFKVWLIPETLKITTFGSKVVGDLVNLEIDRTTQVIVDTVRSFLHQHLQGMLSSATVKG